MESYCEIWEGFLGMGSWHKRYAKLDENNVLILLDS